MVMKISNPKFKSFEKIYKMIELAKANKEVSSKGSKRNAFYNHLPFFL